MKKKWVKITLLTVFGLLLVFGGFVGYFYFKFKRDTDTTDKPYKHYIGYIDQEKALLNDRYELCYDGNLYHTYNGAGLKAYFETKKRFRNSLEKSYNATENYMSSGYLNFRFLVNCEGNPGWFKVIQMNLDLVESKLDKNMVDELLKFTSDPVHWNSIEYKGNAVNYYMYVSYRLENGKVTEIIP